MYTLEQLQSKTFGELKKIGDELNVLPGGDRRRRQSWIEAIAGVNPPLLQLLEVSPGPEVEQVQPIIETVEASAGVEVEPAVNHKFLLCLKEGHTTLWYDGKNFVYEKWSAKTYCKRGVGSAKHQLRSHPEVKRLGNLQVVENSPGVDVDRVQEAIEYAVKTSPGVDVDRVQDIINQTWTSWEKQYCAWLKNAKWCIYRGENKRIDAFLPVSKTLRLEGMKQGTEYCAIWEVSECTYDFNGNPLSVCSSLYTQEPIAEAAETSPAAKVDPFKPKCSECFDDGYIEDEYGRVTVCRCNKKPKLSRQKTQSAIAPAAKISLDAESDRNRILTGIHLSDRFVARYCAPQAQQLRYQVADEYNADADGQLNLLSEVIIEQPEPPDPDNFESIDAFREAIARWDWEHPSSFDHCSDSLSSVHCQPSSVHCQPSSVHSEPLEVSLDSFCEWAPRPLEWYEPTALLEPSEVLELSEVPKSSSTSDFFIPTFDEWCERLNGDEPPDTGIFARLPKPKPPNFPPQAASWTQVGHKSVQLIPKLSRNYPETIPKQFSRVAAGSSNQPARSPPGGDA